MMRNEVLWFEQQHAAALPPLQQIEKADAVVVGGGVAGLTAAGLLRDRGLDVVLVEAITCGSGATGRSSGFITPASELGLSQLARRFGDTTARRLWDAARDACDSIRNGIVSARLRCDMLLADSCFVANGKSGRREVDDEHEAHARLGYRSTLYEKHEMPAVVGSNNGYAGAVRFGDTFSINGHAYAIALRDHLVARGVRIYENSPVGRVSETAIHAGAGRVDADLIFLCIDRFLDRLGTRSSSCFHAQTCLGVTPPQPKSVLERMFPDGDLLVWDTDLIYQYFRRTADDRVLAGGGLLRQTYAPQRSPAAAMEHLRTYLDDHFPFIASVPFEFAWSGLIGVTKDLLPLAGRDRKTPSHFYGACAAGIPWSVLAARCAVNCALDGGDELEEFFSPQRAFTDLDPLQPVARKTVTFALSHYYTKNALRGTSRQIVRRRRTLGVILAIVATLAVLLRRRR